MLMTAVATAGRTAAAVLSAALVAALLITTARASGGDPDPSLVRTDQGALRGTVSDSARTFWAIPYAEPATEWRGVRDATATGAATGTTGTRRVLTVTTPRGVSVGAGKPVVVLLGEVDRPTTEDTIVVTVSSGDVRDQRTALRWVKRNATAFGGDPFDVTLVGRSSEAPGICAQLGSPDAAYLFESALIVGEPCGRDGVV